MLAQIITMQAKPSQMETALNLTRNVIAPSMQVYPGFHHWYSLVDWELEKVLSIAIWQNEASMNRFSQDMLPQMFQKLGKFIDVEAARIDVFEIVVDKAKSGASLCQ